MGRITGFKNSTTGIDIGQNLVEKSYLIDRYPELADTFKQAGLWGWGDNSLYGGLGDGTTVSKSSPVQTVAGGTNWRQVSAGLPGGGAIKTDGTLWMWGSNGLGFCGDGTSTSRSSPVQTIAGGSNWKQVSVGSGGAGAIKTDGTLWMWGVYTSIGNSGGTTSSPVQTVAGGTNWKQLSTANDTAAAIKTDGTLWLWGRGAEGQLGDGTAPSVGSPALSPVQTIAGGTNWKQVSADSTVGAIKTDGTLWMWGDNFYGQLGDNTRTSRSSPVQTVAGGTNWKQVSTAGDNVGAIKTDGTLWAWGYGGGGKLGDGGNGFSGSRSSPVQTVAGGTNWKQISAGYNHTSAIKTDGTLWLWGSNGGGQLGDNTRTSRSSPVQTIAGGTNWKQISSGYDIALAIRDDSADIFGNPV